MTRRDELIYLAAAAMIEDSVHRGIQLSIALERAEALMERHENRIECRESEAKPKEKEDPS